VAVAAGLRAEAAAHELADDTHLVLGQRKRLRQLAADTPDVLGRDVDVDAVAAPLADALVRLHRVVVERLRRVGGLDEGVCLGEAAFVVAALIGVGLGDDRAAADGLLGVEERLELLPVDLDQPHCRLGLLERLGRDRGDRVPLVVGLCSDAVDLARADRGQDAWSSEGGGEVDPAHLRARVWAVEERRVEHPGELDVGGVARLAAGFLEAVEARRVPADHIPRSRGPLDERILVDERPDLFVAALDLFLGLDQPRQLEIASSMRG
jgi:hypothetical protein